MDTIYWVALILTIYLIGVVKFSFELKKFNSNRLTFQQLGAWVVLLWPLVTVFVVVLWPFVKLDKWVKGND